MLKQLKEKLTSINGLEIAGWFYFHIPKILRLSVQLNWVTWLDWKRNLLKEIAK
jgi:hypothetical protein